MLRRSWRFSLSTVEDSGFDDLAGAKDVLRVVDALFGADFADVDHAFDAFSELNEGSELGEAGDRAFDRWSRWGTSGRCRPRGRRGLLEAEGDAALGGVDVEDEGFDGVAGFEQVAGLADLFGPGHLADVDEAFDAGFEFDEGAEVGDAGDGAADAVATVYLSGTDVPGVRLELLEAEGDAAGVGVDLEDLGVDGLADGEDVGGLGDAVPGDVAMWRRPSTPPMSTKAP